MLWSGEVRHGKVRSGAVRMLWFGPVQARSGFLGFGAVRMLGFGTVRCGKARQRWVRLGLDAEVWFSQVRLSRVMWCSVQSGHVWRGCCGIVWCGFARWAAAWLGTVWSGKDAPARLVRVWHGPVAFGADATARHCVARLSAVCYGQEGMVRMLRHARARQGWVRCGRARKPW